VGQPVIRILLHVASEDVEALVLMALGHKLASIDVDLDDRAHLHGLGAGGGRIVFAAHRVENFGFGDQVFEAFFVLNRSVRVFERILKIAFAVDQVIGGFVPRYPGVLLDAAQLGGQFLLRDFEGVDFDFERYREFLPLQNSRG